MSHEHDRPDRRGAWYRKNPGDLGTDESIRLNFSVKIPMTPFLGCVGVAPAGGMPFTVMGLVCAIGDPSAVKPNSPKKLKRGTFIGSTLSCGWRKPNMTF